MRCFWKNITQTCIIDYISSDVLCLSVISETSGFLWWWDNGEIENRTDLHDRPNTNWSQWQLKLRHIPQLCKYHGILEVSILLLKFYFFIVCLNVSPTFVSDISNFIKQFTCFPVNELLLLLSVILRSTWCSGVHIIKKAMLFT